LEDRTISQETLKDLKEIKMFLKDLLKKIGVKIDSVTICTPFFEVAITQDEKNKEASWKLYVELITRVATQPLLDEYGDDETALNSIHKLFDITREIVKEYGREAETFSMLSICLLNLGIRPFTSKWHKIFMENDNNIDEDKRKSFRVELRELQKMINKFAALLLQMSKVETYESINFNDTERQVLLLETIEPYIAIEES
jgi:hypothetical protein